jgi:phosphoribosyl 1,2-cyclic phosphodiesterase
MGKKSFTLRFWGVRGSIPASNSKTVKFGGNTSCVEVRWDKKLFILDAGSGIRELGNHLLKKGKIKGNILFSHLHWDHVQGLPFFVPAYIPGNEFNLFGPAPNGRSLRNALAGQMSYPYFPVGMNEMASKLKFRSFKTGRTFHFGPIEITTHPLRHPQKATAYRFDCQGHSFIYASDTEHLKNGRVDPHLLKACRGVDCLIYDATYTNREYKGNGRPGSSKVGWGHSTWQEAVKLAQKAQVKQLILFHHEPNRTDHELLILEKKARKQFANTRAAREGMVIKV